MSINLTILNEIKPYQYEYRISEVFDLIEDFLLGKGSLNKRQNQAIKIIEEIMNPHGKKGLHKSITELAKIEHGIFELQPWIRDHVVHSVQCFLLGIYINEKFYNYDYRVDPFQWKLACLFHDVGYPVQIAQGILQQYIDKIMEIDRLYTQLQDNIKFRIIPVQLSRLSNNISSFNLIQRRMNSWDLSINARDIYRNLQRKGKVCHGMLSALTVLYLVDHMYQKYNPERKNEFVSEEGTYINWDQSYFEIDVVNACTSIFLHNLSGEYFKENKIDRRKAPLAFLLKLSDTLQEWERPSYRKRGISARNFDIEIKDSVLTLKAKLPEDRKIKILNELESCLVFNDIELV